MQGGNKICSDTRHDAALQWAWSTHTDPFTSLCLLARASMGSCFWIHTTNTTEWVWRNRKQSRADLSGVPASCATTCRPKSKGCLSSLEMGCTRRDPSGRMARKYSLSPTTSCSWLREALPTALERAVKAKPCACAACWNACKSQASVWSVLQQH